MKKGTRKWVMLGAAGLAVVAAMFFAWRGGDASGNGAMTVETSPLERGDIVRSVATSGSVRPLITVEVGSQLSGQVAEIYVDFNSPVEKDQIIALIDAQTFETRVLQDRANLEVARSNVVMERAAIERAQANLRKARLEHERAEPLRRKGTLSASEYDTALAGFESAKADLTMAEARLENALAAVKQRQALLESSQIDLERTKIRSPIDGVVIERAVDQGQTVAASLSAPVLFRIARDLAAIQIEANVDEADIGNVRAGNPVTFSVDAYADESFSGTVDQVRLAPNEQNNVVTYTVIITAENPGLKLLPGMTAIVEIVTGMSEDVLRVANEAVRFKPPVGSELAALAPQSHGTGRRAGGSRDLEQTAERLGLDKDQVKAIEADFEKVFAGMRSRFSDGGDREAMRQQIRQQMTGIFRKHLTADQFRRYEQLSRERAEAREGQLWIRDENGDIRPVAVRFGIGDETHTQVISRELREGAEAVTRMREPRG